MELEITMVSKISQTQKSQISCFHSLAESRPKIIITIIMRHKPQKGLLRRISSRAREEEAGWGRGKGQMDESTLHI
jgi:hypothetical protein